MSEYSKKFIALDLETSHLSPREGQIIEASAVEVELVFDSEQQRVLPVFGKEFDTLVNPEIEVPVTALELTGIKQKDLEKAPLWKEVRQEFREFIGEQPVLGHNVGFDLDFLRAQGIDLKKNTVLDSLEVSQTFLPVFFSHALEYLRESFGIKTKDSHRALADSKTSAWVVAESINKFLTLGEEVRKRISDLLVDSDLSMTALLKELPESITVKKKDLQAELPLARIKEEKIDFDWQDKTIYELPVSFVQKGQWLQYLARQKKIGVVGVSHPIYLHDLPANQILRHPDLSICEKKMEYLLKEKSRLSSAVRRMIVKILIMQVQREGEDALSLAEIRFDPQEREKTDLFSVDLPMCLEHGCRYIQNLKNKQNLVFADLKTLFTLDQSLKSKKEKSMLLFDLAEIERMFADHKNRSWNLKKVFALIAQLYPLEKEEFSWMKKLPPEAEKISAELDMFFGILHLIYLKKDGEFSESLVIDSRERDSQRFQKLTIPAEKLADRLQVFINFLDDSVSSEPEIFLRERLKYVREKLEQLKDTVKQIFLEKTDDQVNWLRFNSEGVDLNISPRDLAEAWGDFSGGYSTVSIVDTRLPEASLDYYMRQLGISKYSIKEMPVEEKKKIFVDIGERAVSVDEVIKLTKQLPGSKILILPNVNQLQKYFESYTSESSGFPIVAYKHSGSLAKIRGDIKKLSEQKQEFILLLTLNALVRYFRELPPAENLIILRIPFESPSSTPIRHQTAGRSDFMNIVVPRTIDLIHRIIFRFAGKTDKKQKVILLDPRARQNYDGIFLKYLNEFPEFEVKG